MLSHHHNRREFLRDSSFGGLALSSLLAREPLNAAGSGVLGGVHHPPKAKRVIQLFMAGAASHLDMFDFKPALVKHHGEKSDFGEHVEAFQNGLGPWMKSPFDFKRYGQSGKLLSDIVAPLGPMADEMASSIIWSASRECTAKQPTYKQQGFSDRAFLVQVHG